MSRSVRSWPSPRLVSDVQVVACEGREHLAQRELVGRQLFGIEHHLVLFGRAAHGVDLDHAGHSAQLGNEIPLQHAAQLHGGVPVAVEHELVDLAEPRGYGCKLWTAKFDGNIGLQLAKTFGDELAGKPDIHRIVEDHRDGAEPRSGGASELAELGQSVEPHFHGECDEALHLFGAEARRVREHGDLHVGDVRHRIDGKAGDGQHAK